MWYYHNMKRTVLNQAQLQLLEQALAAHGSVVTFADLAALLPGKSAAGRRTFVKTLVDAGWLVRIKRGVFQIADMSSLGTLSISRLAVAQIIVPDSYVSFEVALQHWGLHDQLPATVTSIAVQQRGPVVIEGIRYRYVKTVKDYYFGWQTMGSASDRCAWPTLRRRWLTCCSFIAAARFQPGGREADGEPSPDRFRPAARLLVAGQPDNPAPWRLSAGSGRDGHDQAAPAIGSIHLGQSRHA